MLVASLTACQRSDEPPLPHRSQATRVAKPAPSSAPLASAKPAPDADPWVRRQLGELRDRTLKWTPRSLALHRLAFAGNRLFSNKGSEIVAIDPSGKEQLQTYPVQGHPQLAALADGSLLGIAAQGTFILRPDAKRAESLRSVVLLPQEALFGTAGLLGHFDAFDATAGRWSSYSIDSKPGVSSLWLPDTSHELPELKAGNCGALLDGTYACFAADRLWHLVTRSRARLLGKCSPGAAVWRVLAAARADQAWLARNDSTLERWWLVHPPKRLSVVDLPWTPLDLAMRGDVIVIIRVVQNRAQPKQLTLVRLDIDGQQRFEQPLTPGTDDQVDATEADFLESEVVIHPRQPWIGFRTSRGTRVLDLDTGATLVQIN